MASPASLIHAHPQTLTHIRYIGGGDGGGSDALYAPAAAVVLKGERGDDAHCPQSVRHCTVGSMTTAAAASTA